MEEIMQERNAADVFFASTGDNLSAVTRALGVLAERTMDGLEYYGITRSLQEVVFEHLRARKTGPYHRLLFRPRRAF